MVYGKKLKREVYALKPDESILDWKRAKEFLKQKKPHMSKKLLNWGAHLIKKRNNVKRETIFDHYLKKVLKNKKIRFLSTVENNE